MTDRDITNDNAVNELLAAADDLAIALGDAMDVEAGLAAALATPAQPQRIDGTLAGLGGHGSQTTQARPPVGGWMLGGAAMGGSDMGLSPGSNMDAGLGRAGSRRRAGSSLFAGDRIGSEPAWTVAGVAGLFEHQVASHRLVDSEDLFTMKAAPPIIGE